MSPQAVNSDDESSGGDVIPYKNNENGKLKEDTPDSSGDDSSDNGEEGIYVVERIMGHEFRRAGLHLLVKWKGYDKPEDYTWEPEDNLLEGAEEVVKEYYEGLGGRPQPPEKPSKKRKSMNESKATPDKTESKKTKKSRPDDEELEDGLEKPPRSSNWERDVLKVETILRDPERGLVAFLQWEDGKTYRVSIQQCYEKCPMKMLHFYEQHLVFKES